MGRVIGTVESRPGTIQREDMAQVADQIRRITPFEWRIWDSGALLTTAGTDDLGLAPGTFGTNVFVVNAGDLKAEAGNPTTRRAITHVALPDYYDSGQSVTIRIRAGMETTVADDTCTVDIECYEVGDDGTASASDLCTTAAQDMNNLTEADKDFTITTTDLVAGDVLEIRLSITCSDGATGTAVTPTIYKAAVLFDARG